MFFYKNLYVGPSIQNPEEVKQNLMIGKGQFFIYVITLSPSVPGPGANQLEIMHCANLKQDYYRRRPPFIIGIAQGRADAIEMVEEITNEAFRMTGDWNAAAYLSKKSGVSYRT